MKISGFTLVRNGVKFDYPFLESLRSIEPLVDELIVNVGRGEDATLERVRSFADEVNRRAGADKVAWFESDWELDNPLKKKAGLILSEQTNLALERCTGDWCFYLQADEVLHEADLAPLRERMESAQKDPAIEGLLFDYLHFYGSYDVVQTSRNAYRREVRAFKRSSGARSVGDAQSFRKHGGGKLVVLRAGARVFHYGWVRTPEAMREKTFFMDQLYHGDPTPQGLAEARPHSGDNYRYKRFWGLKKYAGTHPRVMEERIRTKGWHWDLAASKLAWEFGDAKKIVLDMWERLTGRRPFEYRSYRLIPHSASAGGGFPAASLIVSTFDMPHHLDLVLEGLARQSLQDFEIIICDDGSGPATREVVEKFKARSPVHVEHLWQEHRGFRKCRILNEGLRKSRGRTIVFLDGDCLPHRDYIRDHVECQEPGRYLAGRRVELGEKISAALTAADVRAGLFDFPGPKLLRSFFEKDSQYLNRCFRVTFGPFRRLLGMEKVADLKGCNYSVSREVLFQINGFDEAYEGYGREDTDAELRLQNAGLKIKSMKGRALQFHIWHPRREFTPANDDRLDEVKRTGKVRCESGLFTGQSQST